VPDFSNEEFLTVAEIASILKLNQQTIRNWIDQRKLPAVHIGRRVRVLRSDFDRLVEGGYEKDSKPQAPSENAPAAQRFWDGS
jgi:excisionase family DNA binding protein